jgi:lipopolysaccharide transport system ATP-binding protein
MSTVITVENLGKKYTLHHQRREQYTALRDVITNGVRNFSKKILSPLRLRSGQVVSRPSSLINSSEEDFWALKDVSFEVNQGDRIGIIGRNGAGKSTLLKILSRITEPTTGSIRIKGRVASLLEVGTGFHPELTGRENIYLNGAILGMVRAEIKKNFDEIVCFAEIEKFLDTPVKHYSSGMYVRLAFAVAAHLEPEILVVDEVLAVGDVEFQKKCLGKMEDVAKEGRTILFVSHNMLAIRDLCSTSVVLKSGRIDYVGHVSSAIEHYLTDNSDITGEVIWEAPASAPGNHQVRLKAVRVISDGIVAGQPRMDKEIEIQVDYWNLEKDGRRVVSIHLFNSMGSLVFTSANLNCCSLIEDPWLQKKYPVGEFKTTCLIPASLLNNGVHSIDLYINGVGALDNIILERNVLAFDVQESEEGRAEYLGEWLGVVRPRFLWQTRQLE